MTELFAVVKDGVFRHEIKGIFTTRALAMKAAILSCKDEYDDYHSFLVLKFNIDKHVKDGELICEIMQNIPCNSENYKSVDQARWIRAYSADGRVIEEFE